MSPQASCLQTAAQRYLFSLVALLAGAVVGCGFEDERESNLDTIEVGLPVVSGRRLTEYLNASESPVLVEFGVDFNCPRCAQTKGDVVRLRDTLKGDVNVIRVDFNTNAQTVAKLGGTICPTYVLFDKGTHVLTRSFPVSLDLLEGDVLRQIGKSPGS